MEVTGELKEVNIIFDDDKTIGYKADLLKYMRKSLGDMANDKDVDIGYLEDIVKLIKNIEENAEGHILIEIAEHVMGGLYWTYVEVVDMDGEEYHWAD